MKTYEAWYKGNRFPGDIHRVRFPFEKSWNGYSYIARDRAQAFEVSKEVSAREQVTVTVRAEFPCRKGGLTADWYEVSPDGTVKQTGEGVR